MKGSFTARALELALDGKERQSSPLSLPPELLAQAARRLSWLALIYAATFFLAFFPNWFTYYLSGQIGFNLNFFVAIIAISIGILIAVVGRKRWLTHSGLLAVGLCFEVIGAFGIALSEFGGIFVLSADKQIYGIGISWICIWIVFFPLILPSQPKIALITALIAASMGPLAFFILWVNSGSPPLPQGIRFVHLILFSLPGYICGGMAYIGARIIYRLGTEVSKERALGSYQLDSRIGRGGMGEVWKARHRMLIRPAAIKLIRPDKMGATGEERVNIVKRFEREAQATAVLRSPHTVELYDYGVSEDGTFYYVMELLDGVNMDKLVSQFGPIPWPRSVFLLKQLCHSLEEAHQHELIHRDIKPANIFVCRFGLEYDFVKVLDFGLVRTEDKLEQETRLTIDGYIGGTPAFMPPEMALGKTGIDGRTDIYAVGCVAYWLLTGELVFIGTSPMEMAMKHIHDSPIPPSMRSEMEIPAKLEEAISKCLMKDPSDRPQTVSELADLLDECAANGKWSPKEAAEWWSTHLPYNQN